MIRFSFNSASDFAEEKACHLVDKAENASINSPSVQWNQVSNIFFNVPRCLVFCGCFKCIITVKCYFLLMDQLCGCVCVCLSPKACLSMCLLFSVSVSAHWRWIKCPIMQPLIYFIIVFFVFGILLFHSPCWSRVVLTLLSPPTLGQPIVLSPS